VYIHIIFGEYYSPNLKINTAPTICIWIYVKTIRHTHTHTRDTN